MEAAFGSTAISRPGLLESFEALAFTSTQPLAGQLLCCHRAPAPAQSYEPHRCSVVCSSGSAQLSGALYSSKPLQQLDAALAEDAAGFLYKVAWQVADPAVDRRGGSQEGRLLVRTAPLVAAERRYGAAWRCRVRAQGGPGIMQALSAFQLAVGDAGVNKVGVVHFNLNTNPGHLLVIQACHRLLQVM